MQVTLPCRTALAPQQRLAADTAPLAPRAGTRAARDQAWRILAIAAMAVVLLAGAGCAKTQEAAEPGTPTTGQVSQAGAFLAYEHSVDITLPEHALATRLQAVGDACSSGRFGACSVLELSQDSGGEGRRSRATGKLSLRIVPGGVQPLIALAADGGSVHARRTKAEDLAQAVADTGERRDLLQRQRDKLLAFQAREDLAVADMIAIASQLSGIEAQLDAAAGASAEQRRRIETNLVVLNLGVPAEDASRAARLAGAAGSLLDSFIDGLVEALETLGFGLPFLLLAFPLALSWRWLWRRATRARQPDTPPRA